MRSGRHAAEDGSFGRSAGSAGLRGALLLLVAVVLGVVLLNGYDDTDGPTATVRAAADQPQPQPQQPAGDGTTTTLPVETTTTTVPSRPPAQVRVLVANGTTTRRAATVLSDRLKAGGYNTLSPRDVAKSGKPSVVYFVTPEFQREAQALAAIVQVPQAQVLPLPSPPPVATAANANVVVVVGTDLAPSLASTSTSSTTR